MRKHYYFESVDTCYTGGGIYVFIGRLTNGNYFMAETGQFDVRLLNEIPDWDNEENWFEEWQLEHLVKDLNSETESPAFFIDMLTWVLSNGTDYYKPDIIHFLDVAREEQAALDR